jgi:hypothetical protein
MAKSNANTSKGKGKGKSQTTNNSTKGKSQTTNNSTKGKSQATNTAKNKTKNSAPAKNGSDNGAKTNKPSLKAVMDSVKRLNKVADELSTSFKIEPNLTVEPESRKLDDQKQAEAQIKSHLDTFIQKFMAEDDLETLSEDAQAALKEVAAQMGKKVPSSLRKVLGVKVESTTDDAAGKDDAGKSKGKSKSKGAGKGKSKSKGENIGTRRARKSDRNDYIKTLIEEGEHTRKELVAKVIEKFPEETPSTVGTVVSDSLNPKYSKFGKVAHKTSDGKITF